MKALLLLTLATLTPLASFAQAAREKEKNEKDDVILLSPFLVTAKKEIGYASRMTTAGSRYSKDLLAIPSSIVLINRQFIADINPQSALDLVSVGVSGVTSVRADIDQFNFRGFIISFMLRDGNMQRGYKRAPLYDIDRVEVIKGPSALSFGNNQFIGGVMNYIPREPAVEEEGAMKVTVSDHGYHRLEAHQGSPIFESDDFTVRYRVNVGMEKGKYDRGNWKDDNQFVSSVIGLYFGQNTSLRITASHYIDDGYKPWGDFLDLTSTVYAKLNQYSTPEITTFAPNQQHVYHDNSDSQFNLKFLSKLTENSNMSIYAAYGNNLADYALARFQLVEPNNYTLQRLYAADTLRTRVLNLTADYLHILERQTWTNEFTAGVDANSLSDYRWGWAKSNQTGVNPVPKLDTRNPNYAPDEIFFRDLFALFPNFQPSKRRYGQQGAVLGRGIPGAYERDQDNVNHSWYLQNNVKFWNDRITAVTGMRWLAATSKVRQVLTNVFTPVADRKFTSYKHGLIFAPVPDVSFYATAAANMIPPVNVLDAFGNVIPDRSAELKEAGIKVNKAITNNFILTGQVVYFDMDQTNAAMNVLNPAGLVVGIQYSAGDNVKGWELDLGARMKFGNGDADVLVTYTTLETQNVLGIPFIATPKDKYSIVAKYSWTSGPLKNISIGANMFDSSEQTRSGFITDEEPIYNAFATYRFQRWRIQLNVNNITDERFVMGGLINNAGVWTPGPFRPRLSVGYIW